MPVPFKGLERDIEVTVLARGSTSVITRVRFPEGHYVRPHTHAEELGAYVVRGRLQLRIENEVRILCASEAYVIPKSALYSVTALESTELIVLRSATDFGAQG